MPGYSSRMVWKSSKSGPIMEEKLHDLRRRSPQRQHFNMQTRGRSEHAQTTIKTLFFILWQHFQLKWSQFCQRMLFEMFQMEETSQDLLQMSSLMTPVKQHFMSWYSGLSTLPRLQKLWQQQLKHALSTWTRDNTKHLYVSTESFLIVFYFK